MQLTHEDQLHVEGLAGTLGVRLLDRRGLEEMAGNDWYVTMHARAGSSMSFVDDNDEPFVYLNPLNKLADTPEKFYFMALHELGHHACGHTKVDKDTLSGDEIRAREAEAWQWARDHANRAPLYATRAYMDRCLATYDDYENSISAIYADQQLSRETLIHLWKTEGGNYSWRQWARMHNIPVRNEAYHDSLKQAAQQPPLPQAKRRRRRKS